ncbi:uncharacterized protein FIBRA_06417 [Fibroporia radiculosa]|uniref:NAD-dependent epimerase/dehydratase domain-containing protein n=1 Tax=Fibroporia radiculosa TaxID=599839 RepID=J4GSP8_9APHY|nr:uncharacterized protein FIBRA_06417 [Fibroporia radiculosa]CCM04250.1 predicted protein [Fibroporia radiculosa]
MPTVTSGKVLVTGANGFVAAWVARKLLEQGYSVRGTVRSINKGKYLQNLLSSYGDRFETVIVENITKEGAFDEAVKGVDAIVHPASPVHLNINEPDDVIVPAVQGTKRLLEAALAHGNAVKRVVYTSSCAAVLEFLDTPRTFSETDWNEKSLREMEDPLQSYCVSKVLAERAAWDFVEQNKNNLSWDLVALNPPYVFGPPIQDVRSPEDLNSSMAHWFESVVKGSLVEAEGKCWIDVRDLAEAHVLAITSQEASGERIIVSKGAWIWQDFITAAHKVDAQLPAGDESYDPTSVTHMIQFDTSKATRIFGLKLRTLEESTRDMIEDFKARGWI